MNVRFGSKAGLALSVDEVGSYPNTGHELRQAKVMECVRVMLASADKACQHSLLPSDEKCRKRTADTKYSDDGKNNRRISRAVHEASDKRLPQPRKCI